MIHGHEWAMGLLAFVSELLGTLSGFGSSTLFLPAALHFEPYRTVLALTALLHCFGNFSRILLFRKHLDRRLAWKLALPSVLLCGLGALLSTRVSTVYLSRGLGAILILLSIFLAVTRKRKRRMAEGNAVVVVGISGYLTGFLGTGGALRGFALMGLSLTPEAFVALSTAVDFGGDVVRAGIYLANGYMDWSQVFYLPILGVASYAASKLAQKLLAKISGPQFFWAVTALVFLSGLSLLLGV